MLYRALQNLDNAVGFQVADAHCDIPCKIYDPSTAIIAALSVVRLMDIMIETDQKAGGPSLASLNTLSRCTLRKEEEAEKVKHEVRIIWGDYFKDPHLKDHPNIHTLVHSIMQKASACKQEVNRDDGLILVGLVNEFSAIFWQTKGVATAEKKSPYPPELSVTYPSL